MKRSTRIIVSIFILVSLIGLDHLTKWAAIHYLKGSGITYRFPGDIFRLQYAENTGAFLSLGAGLPDGLRAIVMTGLNAVILGGLLCYLFLGKRVGGLSSFAFSLVAAGGIGNLIDRIYRDGRVVDFMNLGITTGQFNLRTGIFNIADVAIMAGLFLVIANEIFFLRKSGTPTTDDPDPKAEGSKQKKKAGEKR